MFIGLDFFALILDLSIRSDSYSALATAFEPVHCEYQLFDSQPTVKTAALPHGKKLNFKDRHVFHAGRFASAADVQALLEAGTY